MSSVVSGVPSDHLTPVFIFHVTVVPSEAIPPLARVGTCWARTATGTPSGPMLASGSRTMRAASESLDPWARYGLRMVGPWANRILRSPPCPRAAAGAAVAGADVGAPALAAGWGAACCAQAVATRGAVVR